MKRRLLLYGIGLVLAAVILAATAALYAGRKISAHKAEQAVAVSDAPQQATTEPTPAVEPAPVVEPEPTPVAEPDPPAVLPKDPDIQRIVDSLADEVQPYVDPIIRAAEKGEAATVKRLLEEGADINRRDLAGYTPLIAAILADQDDVAALLIVNKADPNAPDVLGITPLMYAIYKGQESTVRHLLEAGADKTMADKMGHTAIQYAKDLKHEGILKLMTE